MADVIDKEKAIRSIVSGTVKSYANGFSTRHLAEVDDDNGGINMKIHNVFIAAFGPEIQYYSALARSLDSSLGNMLEGMAISIAELNYKVSQHVEGILYKEQTDYIAELLEQYKRGTFDNEELYYSRDFWNLVCESEKGFDIVMDEYKKNVHFIKDALDEINIYSIEIPDDNLNLYHLKKIKLVS